MKRVVLLFVLFVSFIAAQSTTAVPSPQTSSPRSSGKTPLAWDYKDPVTAAPVNPTIAQPNLNTAANPPTISPVVPTTSSLTPCPPPTGCFPLPSNCPASQITTLTFSFNGLVCPGCQICVPTPPSPPPSTSAPSPQCPSVECPAIPSGCHVTDMVSVNVGSVICKTCEQCITGCSVRGTCPSIAAGCKAIKVNQTTSASGRVCNNCPFCRDCPVPTCTPLSSSCVNVAGTNFTTPWGDVCKGCPTCRDNECPVPSCPSLPSDCIQVQNTTVDVNGLICPGCPICKKEAPKCPSVKCRTATANCTSLVMNNVTLSSGKVCDTCNVCESPQCPTLECPPLPNNCSTVSQTTITINNVVCHACFMCNTSTPECPQRTDCPPIPAGCDKTITTTFTLDNGKVCTNCQQCVHYTCPSVSCSPIVNCKNVTNTTFLYKGEQCPGCPKCNDRKDCPPLEHCVPIPDDCIDVDHRTRVVDGLTCSDCPVCKKHRVKCPTAVNCPAITKDCKSVTATKFVYKGLVCKGCDMCSDCPKPNSCKSIKNDCSQVTQKAFAWKEKQCLECVKCDEPKCPPLKCPSIPSSCKNAAPRWKTVNGTKCPDCPDTSACDDCPQLKCHVPDDCKDVKSTWTVINGKKCPGCPVCKRTCPQPHCPPIPKDCLKTEDSFYEHMGMKCIGCPRCVRRKVCPIPECNHDPSCKKWEETTFKFHGLTCTGCPKCTECEKCKPVEHKCPQIHCPKIDRDDCWKIERRTYEMNGLTCPECERCIKKPKCVKCDLECPKKKFVDVEIVKYITHKKRVPYVVYVPHVPQNKTNFEKELEIFESVKRFKYITVIKYRIKQYRTLIIHFRQVLAKLVTKRVIELDTYMKLIKIIKMMRLEMENQVRLGSCRLETIEKEMKRVRFLLKKLGEKSYSPVSICKSISGKRICGLHPNYFYFHWESKQDKDEPMPLFKKTYLRHTVWTTEIYTLEPSVVIKIKAINRKQNVVTFIRRAARWTKRTIYLHSQVKKHLWIHAISKLFKKSREARVVIQKNWGILDKRDLKSSIHSRLIDSHRKSVTKVLKTELTKMFHKQLHKIVREHVRESSTQELIKKHANVATVKEYPTRETEEMMRLPKSVLNLDGNTLIQILSTQFKFE